MLKFKPYRMSYRNHRLWSKTTGKKAKKGRKKINRKTTLSSNNKDTSTKNKMKFLISKGSYRRIKNF